MKFLLILDPALRRLARLAETRQAAALRPSTQSNHKSILSKFVRFVARCRADFKSPQPEIICMFLEQCLGSVKSPATARNYISALTSAYNRMGLDSSPFSRFKVKNALLSIDKNVRHTPLGALPVSPALLKKSVRVIRRLPNGVSIAAAVIIMFHTFHRQSNFSAQSASAFDPSRQMTRGDITVYPDHLRVAHKWSKSHQASGHHAVTSIPAIPGNPLCPRRAFLDMT